MAETGEKFKSPFVKFLNEDLKLQHVLPNEADYETNLSRFLGNKFFLIEAFIDIIENLGSNDWLTVYQSMRRVNRRECREAAKSVDALYCQTLLDGPNAARKFALLRQAELGLYPKNWWDPRYWHLRNSANQAANAVGRAVLEIQNHQRVLKIHHLKYFPDKKGQPLNIASLCSQATLPEF